jgi:hypothetical protein
VLRLQCVVLLSCSLYGFQQDTDQADAAREKDAYASYSLMLMDAPTSHGPDNNERYLIAEQTATQWPTQPCITPPASRKKEFGEVLADYERRKTTARPLKRALSIRKPYLFLDAEQVRALMGERALTRNVPEPTSELFQGVTDIFTLSDVYFNAGRTLALTAMSSWCGSLCGRWQWRVFEKSATGEWEERRWIGCFTMAELFPSAN